MPLDKPRDLTGDTPRGAPRRTPCDMPRGRPAVSSVHRAPPASRPAPDPSAGGQVPERRGRLRYRGAAYALLTLLTGTNLATPLYPGYADRFGLSPLTVTLVFAVYVAALVPALLGAGRLTAALGRRALLLAAVGAAALGALGFAAASGPSWLFAARALQGLALGAASGPLTAALTELQPAGDARRAALTSTVVSVGGLGLGPVLGGLLAEYAPAPYVLPFVLELVLLVPAGCAVAALPAAGRGPRGARRRSGPLLAPAVRPVFAASGATAFLAFAVTGLFLALMPSYVTTLTGSGNLLLAGGAVALLPACSALAQLAGYGRAAPRLWRAGLPLLAAGLGLLALAGRMSSPAVLLAAVVGAGAGQGLVFLGALTAVGRAVDGASRAEVLSAFYVVVYLGVGVPVIGVGLLATAAGLLPAVQGFAVVAAVLCAGAAVVVARRGAGDGGR